MQKKQTIGYDQTKKMLNTLRKLNETSYHSKPLLEQVGTTGPSQEQRNTNDVSNFPSDNPKAEMKINNDMGTNSRILSARSSEPSILKIPKRSPPCASFGVKTKIVRHGI